MHPLLATIERPFAARVRASRAWVALALQMPRVPLALGLALVPALLLLASAPLLPEMTSPDRVREVFTRYISGLITAATIAVGFGALALRRGIKGIGELQEHMEADEEFRERARKLLDHEGLPVDVGGFLVELHRHLAEEAQRARRDATQADLTARLDGVPLGELLDTMASASTRSAAAIERARGQPPQMLEAALDFEHDVTGHLTRRFKRHAELSEATRARMAKLEATIEAAATGTFYVKTLDTQWGLSRMATSIATSAFCAVVVATFVALGYDAGMPLAARLAILAPALFVIALPLGFFVSYVLRFVFVNQYSAAIGAFTLGPENEDALQASQVERKPRQRADLRI